MRIYDYSGGGGIYGNDISLMVRGIKDMLKITPAIKEVDRVITGVSEYTLPSIPKK